MVRAADDGQDVGRRAPVTSAGTETLWAAWDAARTSRPHHGWRTGQDAEALSDIRLWPRLALDRTRPGRNPRIDLRNEGHDRAHPNPLPARDRLIGPRTQDPIRSHNANLRQLILGDVRELPITDDERGDARWSSIVLQRTRDEQRLQEFIDGGVVCIAVQDRPVPLLEDEVESGILPLRNGCIKPCTLRVAKVVCVVPQPHEGLVAGVWIPRCNTVRGVGVLVGMPADDAANGSHACAASW